MSKRIGEFEFVDIGLEHSQYFQGFGSAFTRFEESAVGCGSNPAEAIDDLLETIAQGDYDVDGMEARIMEDMGVDSIPSQPLASADEGSEEYYYVGLRWNEDTSRGERLERALTVGDVCRYESYEPKPKPKFDSYGIPATEWHYVKAIPEGDKVCSYGDLKTLANRAAIDKALANGETLYILPRYMSFSDYSGSTVDAANHRAFQEQFPSDHVYVAKGGWDTTATVVALDWLISDEGESALEALEQLADYPVLDDSELSKLESEQIDSAWDSWAEYDFRRALEKAHGVEIDRNATGLRELFESARERANEEWFNEGSGPDMVIRVDSVVEKVTADEARSLMEQSL